jgi:putative peptidoglycan lipid II flippase
VKSSGPQPIEHQIPTGPAASRPEPAARGADQKVASESAFSQIARAAGLVVGLFLVSRILGLAREMVISHQFGTSGALDAYLAAFRLPDILFQIVAGGALASAFIPTFTGYLAKSDKDGGWRLASSIINLVVAITSVVAVVAAALAPLLVSTVIAPGFDPDRQALTVRLMRMMLVTPIVFGVSGVIMGILNAQKHFLLPALAPIIYNLSIIAGALLLAPAMGVQGLALGVVAGAFGHLAIQLPGLVRYRMRYTAAFGLRNPGVHEVGRLMLPRMLGLAAVQLNFLVNTILASGLVAGSISALNYAWLLMLLPQGIFAQAVATVAFPTFSTQEATGQRAEMRSTLAATLRVVLFLAVPAAVGLIVLRVPLVGAIFQRGSFTATSTGLVAPVLALFALGLPAHSVVEIVVRAFYAMHDTKTPVLVGIGAMALNVLLSLTFIAAFRAAGWQPIGGLALSNSLATTLEMGALLAILRGRLSGLEGKQMAGSLARTGVAAAGMGLVAAALATLFSARGPLVAAGMAMVVGVGVYAALSLLLGAQEPRLVWEMVRPGRRPRTGSR